MKLFGKLVPLLPAFVILCSSLSLASDSGFRLGPEPVWDTSLMKGWDGGEIDPGAIVFHDGRFHVFYNAFETGVITQLAPYSIGYATSLSGHDWKKESDQPILTFQDQELDGMNMMATSALFMDGQWVMYLTVSPAILTYVGYVVRATAPAPQGPWTVNPEPIISPGSGEDWDSKGIGHVNINKTDAGYVMHYTGWGSVKIDNHFEDRGIIGMAVSEDGINWIKHDDDTTQEARFRNSDPVMELDESPGSWENWHLYDANVQYDDGKWYMVYRSGPYPTRGKMGFAESTDGINWDRSPFNPIASGYKIGERGLYFTSYVRLEGKDYIWFEAGTIDDVRIYLMTRP